ncbi:hypothetical protein EXIGLDRAFT_304399 [Exidia glandulosa HHB12029]|uniref:Protein NO VEIN C-terminal domain-containing protein n=1 Tax=Exidia glandulosa HHB12029 TaxID=1314781 RepID=A0A165D504_EXIGL|nr:hypothetical protein EXIGLDRAFT_304399 [Exidia glandulosa HHB12029]
MRTRRACGLCTSSSKRVSTRSPTRSGRSRLRPQFFLYLTHCRVAFQTHNLIFAFGEWLPLSRVVWDGPLIMTLKIRLKPLYSGVDELFHKHLGILDASASVIELRDFVVRHRTLPITGESRDRLTRLLDFAASSIELIRKGTCKDWTVELRSLAFLPVRRPGCSSVMLSSCEGQFFLPDPSGHFEGIFNNLVAFLDVEPAHAVMLRPLFAHFDMESKRIDRCVTETVIVDSKPLHKIDDALFRRTRVNREETTFFKQRLPFFQRLQYYKLASDASLIQSIRVLKANRLDVTYTVNAQRPVTLSRPLECWAREVNGELQLFVLSSLPLLRRRGTSIAEALAKCLGLSDSDIPITAAILRYDPDEADVLLRKSGVRELEHSVMAELSPRTQDPEDEDDELRQEILNGFRPPARQQQKQTPPHLGPSAALSGGVYLSSSYGSYSGSGSGSGSWRERPPAPIEIPLPVSPVRPTMRASRSSTAPEETIDLRAFVESEEGRNELIHLQIFAAQTLIPGVEATTLGSRAQRLYETPPASPTLVSNPSSPTKRTASTTVDLTDVSPVGYLGEKYVFDLLKDQLPNFGYENWTSTLRILAGFPAFIAESLADFTYEDTDGSLTEKLYPGSTSAMSPRPEYLMEVKATSGDQNDTFFMSRNQFHQALHLSRWGAEADAQRRVYVLFRVSGIGSGRTPALKIYADPHALLAQGVLRIESEKVEVRIA